MRLTSQRRSLDIIPYHVNYAFAGCYYAGEFQCTVKILYKFTYFQLEDDEKFKEFLALHKNPKDKKSWANDVVTSGKPDTSREVVEADPAKQKLLLEYAFEGESDSSDEETVSKSTLVCTLMCLAVV